MRKKFKTLPKFKNEREEARFWTTHDSTDYVDYSKARRVGHNGFMKSHSAALRKEAPTLLARYRYPIQWHRGKGTWSAWPVGLPVVAMDTTREKTRRKLYRAIESHLECLMERGLPLPPPPRKAKGPDEVYAIAIWRS
jgi:predicted RNase H-like HicB family nuclease